MYKLRIVLVSLILTFVGTASADHQSKSTIEKRTQPTGKVYRQGDDVPVAKQVVAEVTSGPRSGEEIYTQKCAMCHASGVAGAPKAGEADAWTARIAKGEAKLIENAINGFQGDAGFMPAKGGCADCSDEETKAAVEYMLAMLK